MKEGNEMNQEILQAEINHYTSLLRIKKTIKEPNKQLEIEIKTSQATLKTFGVDISQFDFLLD
mgnify:CR=1 FL=1